VVATDAHAGGVQPAGRPPGLGLPQLPHGGDLGDGDVVEHAEGADHQAGEQEAGEVEVAAEGLEEADLLVDQTGEVGEVHERQAEHAREQQARHRADQRHRCSFGDAVGEVEGGQGHGRGADQRHPHRRLPVEERRQHEPDQHHHADPDADHGEEPPPSSERHDHGDEEGTEQQQGRRPLEVGELVPGGVGRGRVVEEDDVVAVVDAGPARAVRQLQRVAIALRAAARHLELDGVARVLAGRRRVRAIAGADRRDRRVDPLAEVVLALLVGHRRHRTGPQHQQAADGEDHDDQHGADEGPAAGQSVQPLPSGPVVVVGVGV
jgi:hypothetical protein